MAEDWVVVTTTKLTISVEELPESTAWVVVTTARLSVAVEEEEEPPEVTGWVVVTTAFLSIEVGTAVPDGGEFKNLVVTYTPA